MGQLPCHPGVRCPALLSSAVAAGSSVSLGASSVRSVALSPPGTAQPAPPSVVQSDQLYLVVLPWPKTQVTSVRTCPSLHIATV